MNYKILLVLLLTTLPISTFPSISYASQNALPSAVAALPGYKPVGQLPPNYPVLVTIAIPLKNQQLLYSLLQQISNPRSPNYDHFLTYEQIKQLFLPVNQFESLKSYLQSKGFKVVLTAMDSALVVEGTAQQVKEYLGLSSVVYSNGTYSYYTLVGYPKIDAFVYASNVTGLILLHPNTLVTEKIASSLAQRLQPNMTAPISAISAKLLWKAYNTTGLLASGINGSGYNIGILDWYGDPYITQVLYYFDKEFGIPNPPSFQVVPIGPYDPNLGVLLGWDGEISGDVELSHAMAPGANVTLYIGNGALPIFFPIAYIDQQHVVQTVSQSWSVFEWYYSILGPAFYVANLQLADEYYALGSLEGITFIASSGDGGGSGYSSGPLGTPGYPSTSPFVTAAGGTTVYVSGNSTVQTAWSNYGFIPFLVNYGGSTGGVSMLEPKPWYQENIPTPYSYPNGRLVPDISLSASVFPGTLVVYSGNVTGIFGGTSEASPLLAGLLTLVMQKLGHPLGLINPLLYEYGYSKNFVEQITYGYNIPWTASPGYNLVTGLGYPNIGMMVQALKSLSSEKYLNVSVMALNSSYMPQPYNEFVPGSTMVILANITYNGAEVSTGSFEATVTGMQGTLGTVNLSYNPSVGLWMGEFTVPSSANGPAYITVSGSSNGTAGTGFTEVFLGFLTTYIYPPVLYPELLAPGTPIAVNITYLSGSLAPTNLAYYASTYSYDFMNNTYIFENTVPLTYIPSLNLWLGFTSSTYPNGPFLISTVGTFGYLPLMNGVDLQTMFILPQTVVEPGAVAPGQYIIIEGLPLPPSSLATITSYATGYSLYLNVMTGSNITAELVAPNGSVVSSANVPFNGVEYMGYLSVPKGLTPGLYTVVLNLTYESFTLGTNITGAYYGQIWVAKSASVPKITVTGVNYEGGKLNIYASITYPNGSEVKHGMYVAALYSNDIQSTYGIDLFSGVPLSYNSTLNEWVGSVNLPSPYSPFQYNITTGTVFVGPQGYSGPYDVYVSGISWNGVPTTAAISAQKQFYINPQILFYGKTLVSPAQTSNLALEKSSLSVSNATLTDDVFLGGDQVRASGTVSFVGDQFYGINYIEGGNVVISGSTSSGTLYLINTNATIKSSSIRNVVAVNSSVTVLSSSISSLALNSSTLSGSSYSISSISPPPASISITSPQQNGEYYSQIPVSITVSGQGVQSVDVYVDGALVNSFTGPGTYSFSLNASSYPDGTHELTVVALQSDGVSSKASVTFETTYQLHSLAQETSSEISTLNSTLISVKDTLSSYMTDYFITTLLIGIIALVLAAYALFRKPK